jgi:hypothetical protein
MLNLANVILMPSQSKTHLSHENAWIDGQGRRGTAGPLDILTIQVPICSTGAESGKRQFDAKLVYNLPLHENVWIDGVDWWRAVALFDISTIQAPKRLPDTESGKRHFDAK